MGQQEYEAFKAKLREWMNTHPDEYAAFEEAMNARDYAGYQSVIFQAMSLIPRYRRLMSAKANEGLFEHVDEIEQAAEESHLAENLIRKCEQPDKDSTIPRCFAGSTSARVSNGWWSDAKNCGVRPIWDSCRR